MDSSTNGQQQQQRDRGTKRQRLLDIESDDDSHHREGSKVVRTVSIPEQEQKQQQQSLLVSDNDGFILQLADEDQIQVSRHTAECLKETCQYFRNAFRHGTQESLSRVISKPDWKRATAEYIIHLIETKRVPVPEQYDSIQEAAEQILLPISVKHPIFGENIQQDTARVGLISNTWKSCTTKFDIDVTCLSQLRRGPNLESNVWDELLVAGTVFVSKEDNGLYVELRSDDSASEVPAMSNGANEIRVGSFAPLYMAVYHTCSHLSEALRNRHRVDTISNTPACMALPLYSGAVQELTNLFDDIEILAIDANNVPTVDMTRCCAPLEQLQQVLDAAADFIAPVLLSRLCYLLIPDPSCELLGKLIHACQLCQDNPGTMGWDIEKNQFCTLKTLRDSQYILKMLLDPSFEVAQEGSLRLVTVNMTSAPEWSAY